MVQKVLDTETSIKLLRNIHFWVLISEKLFKSVKLPIKYSKLYQDMDNKYSEAMKLFTPIVGVLKRYQNNDDYISKLITMNTNVDNLIKKSIQNLNYNPINSNFNIFFTTTIANSILMSAEIVTHRAFYKTEYDSICTRMSVLYDLVNEITNKLESRYLSRYGINEDNKNFNNDVRVPIDQCIFSIEKMLDKMDVDILKSELYSPFVHRYTHEELVDILKERLHIDEHTKLDPDYKVTTTCVLVTKTI